MEMALGRFGDRRLEKGGGAPRRNGACGQYMSASGG